LAKTETLLRMNTTRSAELEVAAGAVPEVQLEAEVGGEDAGWGRQELAKLKD
jgi:hypothetical protein